MNEKKLLKRKHKALSEGNKQQLATICIDLADNYFKEGHYEDCIKEYKTVAEIYKKNNKAIDYARAHRMIGESYTHLREYDKALIHQQIHLDVAKREADELEQQRALATIGHTNLTIYLDTEDKNALNFAYKSFMKSLDICESLTNISKREHMDMTARLFANLGVVQECLGNYDEGIELLQKSINICKNYDIFEQLERGYTFLGSLFVKKNDFSNAIHQYNLAIEVAGRLDDKKTLISAALSAKADILIKLADFQGTKQILLKAYKLKSPNVIEHQLVTQNLKVIAAMCYTEDALLTVTESDYKMQKKLYEKMGDGACELKNYEKAIEYYHKMLEAAKKSGESGKELSSCFVSLAQTYSDNKQYDLAMEYFQKEYVLYEDNVKECLGTLFSIADTLEAAGKHFHEIDEVYKRAIARCEQVSDTELEGKTLCRYVITLKKFNKLIEAEQMEKRLCDIGYIPPETESEGTENTPNIGDDVSIEDITDISDPSDTEVDLNKPRRATRRRTKAITIKRNKKGETQLHTACIAGNLTLVQHLIDQGHVINVRDNCGWLPLHEASNHGYLEIVRLLLNKGALINDRGGVQCHGVTPLHDAASNGHLEVIELLLDNGASPVVKTDDGETALFCLKRWRSNVQLTENEEIVYNRVVQRMSQALEMSGQKNDILVNKENLQEFERPRETRTQIRDIRRQIVDDDNSDTDENDTTIVTNEVQISPSKYFDPSPTVEYKEVMEKLRHRNFEENSNKKRKSLERKPALIQSSFNEQNWLEDDLGINSAKKRKTTLSSDLLTTNAVRKSTSSKSLTRKNSASSNKSGNETIPECFLEDVDFEETLTPENFSHELLDQLPPSTSSKSKRKIQTSLTRAGFECNRRRSSGSNSSPIKTSPYSTPKSKQQIKLTQFTQIRNVAEADSTSEVLQLNRTSQNNRSPHIVTGTSLPVDVRIDGRLYRVPVPVNEVNTLTIKWLAEEASKRYCRKEFMKPILELETSNGAVLADDDVISILFPCGQTQAEELQARVLKWNVPSLLERYEEACHNANCDPVESLIKTLEETSINLDLSNENYRSLKLIPLLKSLNRQTKLQKLNLSGNFMTDESMEILTNSLPTLHNLIELNLSLNHLTSYSIKYLSELFVKSDKEILKNLVSLDLSYNSLSDECLYYIGIITRYINFEKLILIDVGFTSNLFQNNFNRNVELCLDYLKYIDISNNYLNKDDLIRIIQFIKPNNLKYLNISNNQIKEEGLTWEMVQFLDGTDSCNGLKEINLSRCMITDSEVYELLRLFLNMDCLNAVNLSYNENITGISLKRLLEHGNLMESINLIGCNHVLKYFNKNDERYWCLHPENKLKSITISVDFNCYNEECDILIDMFKRNNFNVVKLNNCLEINCF